MVGYGDRGGLKSEILLFRLPLFGRGQDD